MLGGELSRNKALKSIYKDNREKVCSYILSNGGSTVEAKDIYQEAIIAFYENVRDFKFKGESTIGTYLYSIARFKWLNELKRKGVKATQYDKMEQPERVSDDALASMIADEQKKRVLSVFGRLGDSCKSVLMESIYHNKSMKEIAEEGGFSSEQIARNKKYKCLQRLKEMISEKPELIKIFKAYE